MKKILLLIFTLSSLCASAQSELSGDTIKNRLPVIKEQIPFSPKESKHTGTFNESQPEQRFQMKVNNWLEIHSGAERIYDPTKMKWTTAPIFQPVINLWKKK